MNRSWNFRRGVLLALAGYTAFLVFAAPQRCADALQAGLRLCGGPLLVSLFPFLIVSALAAGCGAGQWLGFVFRPAARLMGIRAKGAGGVLLIGVLGGFAPAAVAASEAVRTGQLTSRQASALLPACVCSGPSFVILTVGQQMLGSRAVGVRLFAAQLLALAGYTAFLVFAAPQRCADALQAGLRLCGGPLLVSLFPFLIVSALAAGCGAGQWLGFVFRPAARLMGIRAKGAGGVLLIGVLGGFAPAAVAASEAVRTGQLTSRQASALLPACVCSGPSFVILTVGQQMLGSRAVGVRLFAAQLLAGYLTAALLCRMQGGAGQAPPAQGETIQLPALDAVIAQAAVTYLKLCGFVLYFRLLAAGCGALLPQPWAALPAMLLEVCSGCDQAARTGLWASTLCCAALSVQGVSVLLQVRTICPAEISLRPLLAARAVHLPLSVALFWLGSTVPVQAVQTFTTLTERVVVLRRVPLDCALLAFAVCCITVEELARS